MIRIMQFAHLINRWDIIDNVVRRVDPNRFSMAVCTFTKKTSITEPDYEAANIPHHALGCLRRADYAKAVIRLAGILKRERIDILHVHHFDPMVIGMTAAKLAGIKRVVIGRHYHDELYLIPERWKRRAYINTENIFNRRASLIIVPSKPIKELLVNRQSIPLEKVRVIPFGMDFSRYEPMENQPPVKLGEELGFPPGAFVIGNFARHHRLKGQSYLLRAMEKLAVERPAVRLLMVGDGPEHQALKQEAQQRGIGDRVHFLGWRRDALRLMSAVDMVVHPTLHESFSQLMVEALILQKPLAITPMAGPSDHIRHQVNGILMPPAQVEPIVEAVRWVIDHPQAARALGAQGREDMLQTLNIERAAPVFEAAYEEVALSHG